MTSKRGLHEDLNNPNLFDENKPGEYTYASTPYGKSAEGQLVLEKGERDGEIQREAGGEDRRIDDDGGHLIGARFNGSKGEKNVDAQNRNLNRGSYKIHENEQAAKLQEGDKVFTHVETYKSNGSQRPDVYMGYTITESKEGTRDWDAFSYTNESQQTQQSWNDSIVENDLMDEYDNPMNYDPNDYSEELSCDDYSVVASDLESNSSAKEDNDASNEASNDEGMDVE